MENIRKISLIGLIFFLVFSCSNLEITNNESKGIDEVLNIYGGACKSSKGTRITNGKTEKFFQLEFSKSKTLNNYAKILEMPASNIALIIFKNIQSESDGYSKIIVRINVKNSKTKEYVYLTSELKEIADVLGIFKSVSDEIKMRNFNNFKKYFDTDLATNITDENFNYYCNFKDSLYGKLSGFKLEGFNLYTENSKHIEIIHLSGLELRKNKNNPIKLLLNRKTKKVVSIDEGF